MKPSNVRKNSKGTTKCKKKTITFDIGTAQCEDGIVKYKKKKVKESPNVKKELSNVMLKLETAQCGDGTVKCDKKIRKPPNVAKELTYVMLELHNVKIEPSNVRKK